MALIRKEIEVFSGVHSFLSESLGKLSILDYARTKAKGKGPKDRLPRLVKHIEEFEPTPHVRSIDGRYLERFIDYLRNAGLNDTTVEYYFDAMNALLNLAVKERLIIANPAKTVKKPTATEKIKSYLTDQEIAALYNTPIMGAGGVGGEIKRAFLFACYTGLRWSDLQTLTWGQIVDGQIRKHQIKTKAPVYIPLHETAKEIIRDPDQDIHKPDEKVFSLTDSDPNQYLKPWGIKAGIKKHFSFHTSRHSAGTRLIEAGVDVYTVQKLLGHSKIEMTMSYAKVSDNKKRAAIDALPGLKLGKGGR